MAASTPPEPAGVGHHVIESIEVSGGYLHGLRAELTLRLNVVIRPPGTRTSTLRKLARFGLGLPVTEVRAKEVSLDGVLFRADFFGPGERPRPSRSAKRARLNDKKKVAEKKKDRRGREE